MLTRLGLAPYRGRRRAGALRDWPVGWSAMVDPWGNAPLFSAELRRQAEFIALGRAAR